VTLAFSSGRERPAWLPSREFPGVGPYDWRGAQRVRGPQHVHREYPSSTTALTFELKVTDNNGATAIDVIRITVVK